MGFQMIQAGLSRQEQWGGMTCKVPLLLLPKSLDAGLNLRCVHLLTKLHFKLRKQLLLPIKLRNTIQHNHSCGTSLNKAIMKSSWWSSAMALGARTMTSS